MVSEDKEFCICLWKLEKNAGLCNTCNNSLVLVESAKKGELSNIILEMLKPVKCSKCDERFPCHHKKLFRDRQSRFWSSNFGLFIFSKRVLSQYANHAKENKPVSKELYQKIQTALIPFIRNRFTFRFLFFQRKDEKVNKLVLQSNPI